MNDSLQEQPGMERAWTPETGPILDTKGEAPKTTGSDLFPGVEPPREFAIGATDVPSASSKEVEDFIASTSGDIPKGPTIEIPSGPGFDNNEINDAEKTQIIPEEMPSLAKNIAEAEAPKGPEAGLPFSADNFKGPETPDYKTDTFDTGYDSSEDILRDVEETIERILKVRSGLAERRAVIGSDFRSLKDDAHKQYSDYIKTLTNNYERAIEEIDKSEDNLKSSMDKISRLATEEKGTMH